MRCPNKHVGVGQVHGCGAHECCHTPLEHDHRDTMRGGESPNALEVTARGEDALQLSRSCRLDVVWYLALHGRDPGLERQRAALRTEKCVPRAGGAGGQVVPVGLPAPKHLERRSAEAQSITNAGTGTDLHRPSECMAGVNEQRCNVVARSPHQSRVAPRDWCGDLATTLHRCSRSEEHTSELQSQSNLVCRLLLEKK